jgi:hypothetical protein
VHTAEVIEIVGRALVEVDSDLAASNDGDGAAEIIVR